MMNSAIVTCDESGSITTVNRAAERVCGYPVQELIGRRFASFITAESAARIREILHERSQERSLDETSPMLVEVEVIRKDHTRCHLRGEMDTLFQTGNSHQSLYMFRETTAEGARQFEAFAMLAHDLRNYLGVSLGYTELLLEKGEAQTGQKTMGREVVLERLRSNALTIHALVTNHLDLAGIEAGHLPLVKVPLDVNAVVQKVVQQYEAQAQSRHIHLFLRTGSQTLLVKGDVSGLERIVTNLLHNALKFTPPHGTIAVRTRDQNGQAVVTVTDSGPGIAPADLPTIFRKYRQATTGQQPEGSGLGLFIAETLVKAHNGRITVESDPGQGCQFTVTLPLSARV